MPLTAAAPVADRDGNWYSPGRDGCVYSWSLQGNNGNGVVRWRQCLWSKYSSVDRNANFTGVAVGSWTVFTVSSNGNLYALSTLNGTVVDIFQPPNSIQSNKTVFDLFVGRPTVSMHDDGNNLVVFYGKNNALYAIGFLCTAKSCSFQANFSNSISWKYDSNDLINLFRYSADASIRILLSSFIPEIQHILVFTTSCEYLFLTLEGIPLNIGSNYRQGAHCTQKPVLAFYPTDYYFHFDLLYVTDAGLLPVIQCAYR